MKKYLLGVVAIMLALVFSSFKKPATKADDNTYYFYVVDANGNIPAGSTVQFGGQVTLAYANLNDGCSGSANDCLRGFTSQPTLPTSLSGNVQTKKN